MKIKQDSGFRPVTISITFESVDEIRDLMLRTGLTGKQVKGVYDNEFEGTSDIMTHDPSTHQPEGVNLYDELSYLLDDMGLDH